MMTERRSCPSLKPAPRPQLRIFNTPQTEEDVTTTPNKPSDIPFESPSDETVTPNVPSEPPSTADEVLLSKGASLPTAQRSDNGFGAKLPSGSLIAPKVFDGSQLGVRLEFDIYLTYLAAFLAVVLATGIFLLFRSRGIKCCTATRAPN